MEERELHELLERYRKGLSTREDKAFLESWYLAHNQSSSFAMDDEDKVKDLNEIWSKINPGKTSPHVSIFYRMAVAASILVFLCAGAYFMLRQHKQAEKNAIGKNDVLPGKNTATLTLANGKKIALDDRSEGQLSNNAGIIIHKKKSGELVYTVSANAGQGQNSNQFNTLSTANGEQYQVVLPDGTHVWLNAASSIKYPVAFGNGERMVELTGEAYFEVVHNAAHPFKVKTARQIVEDIGTHFNINAYDDEPAIKTTLIEGAVKVSSMMSSKILFIKPGQQSQLNEQGLSVASVDVDEVLAWKNGNFDFDDESLESTMRKIAKWYDVQIVYAQKPAGVSFFGEISRSKNLSAVLSALSITGKVHFRMDAKKIIVSQ